MLGAGDNSVETELKRALERNISVNTIFLFLVRFFYFYCKETSLSNCFLFCSINKSLSNERV